MRAIIALTAMVLLTSPAWAQSQLMTPVTDFTDLRHEPNVLAPGIYPHPNLHTPLGYPADPPAIGLAKLAGEPVRILEARPAVACYVNPVHSCTVNWLLADFDQQDFITPWTHWRAVYGHWTDLNGDGYIQSGDWDNDGGYGPINEITLVHRDHASASGNEWSGITAASMAPGTKLVTYFSPRSGTTNATRDGREPAILYRDDGRHGAHASLIYIQGDIAFFGTFDSNVVTTAIAETFVGIITPDSPDRRYQPIPGEPWDTDIYKSLDPTLESLYHTTVRPPAADAITVLDPVNDAIDNGYDGVMNLVAPHVGPAAAAIRPLYPPELEDNDYGREAYEDYWHPYMDVQARLGLYAPTPQLVLSGAAEGISPSASGQHGYAPMTMMYPLIRFGLWWDRDADGYVGNGTVLPDCGDKTNCGLGNTFFIPPSADPNVYRTGGADVWEWTSVCSPQGVTTVARPDTPGEVWPYGVYIMGDDPADGRDDNHLDDAYNDILANGVPQRLVFQGPISMTSECNASNSPHQYFSNVVLLFPGGNPDYDILIEGERTCINMQVVGLPESKCSRDTDRLAAWAT